MDTLKPSYAAEKEVVRRGGGRTKKRKVEDAAFRFCIGTEI